MFICVSLNPAIDKRLLVERLVPGQIHRARSVEAHAGGKAAHVAMVLRAMGEEPRWIGPAGGATGAALVAGLRALGIQTYPIQASRNTRTNIEILDDAGTVTELLEPGGTLSGEELEGLQVQCVALFKAAKQNVTVLFSGSLPPGSDPYFYKKLISRAHDFGCRTILDAGSEPLKLALSAEPFFVKPNRDEAQNLVGKTIDSLVAAASVLRQLLEMGARSAALSLGADGMLYCAGKDMPIFFAAALKLPVRSTVGCGDAALAGFARSFSSGAPAEHALRLAAACASANCIADSPGAIRFADIETYLSQTQLEKRP